MGMDRQQCHFQERLHMRPTTYLLGTMYKSDLF